MSAPDPDPPGRRPRSKAPAGGQLQRAVPPAGGFTVSHTPGDKGLSLIYIECSGSSQGRFTCAHRWEVLEPKKAEETGGQEKERAGVTR